MSTSGIESPVLVTMSPVSSPTQSNTNTNATTNVCENVASQLMLVLPDLEEMTSMEQISSSPRSPPPAPAEADALIVIELQEVKEPHPNPEKEKESKTKLIEEEKVVTIVKDFNYCYDEFQKQLKTENVVISMETIMRMLRVAMVIVEQTSQTGKNKKDFVIRMIAKIVSECDISTIMSAEMKLEILNMLYSPLFDDTIKLVVDASKGTLDLNKVQEVAAEVAKGCFSKCLAFLSKKK